MVLLFVKYFLALAIIITIIQHFITPVYQFKEGNKFEGDVIYNPYQSSKADWLKMNLHAHSKAWGGLTNGMKQNNDDVIREYSNLGYDIIGISNYHDPQHIFFKGKPDSLTVYEYGINLFKAHRLVIGYNDAIFREVTLFHTIHDRQYILNSIYPNNKVLIIAHPQFGKGHEMNDFKYLSNYNLIEVLNHYRYSEGEWDLALSHGKPVFIIGNDDMHDLDKPGEVAVRYTMVDGKENLNLTFDELKLGNAYAVASPDRVCPLKLDSCKLDGKTLNVQFNEPADKILFIGDGGIVRDSALMTDHAAYTFTHDDTYIRTIATKSTCKVYLNPAFRTPDGNLPRNEQHIPIDWLGTIIEKILLFLLTLIVIRIIIKTPVKF